MRGDYHDPDCKYSAAEPCTCGLIASIIGRTPTPARSEAASHPELAVREIINQRTDTLELYAHDYVGRPVTSDNALAELLAGVQLLADRHGLNFDHALKLSGEMYWGDTMNLEDDGV